jgi:hypothetical protein
MDGLFKNLGIVAISFALMYILYLTVAAGLGWYKSSGEWHWSPVLMIIAGPIVAYFVVWPVFFGG